MKVKDMSDEQLNITIQKQGKIVFVPAVIALIVGIITIINLIFFGSVISVIDAVAALGAEGILCSLSAVIYSYLLYCKTERRIRDVTTSQLKGEQ